MGTHWIKKPGKDPGNTRRSWAVLFREKKGSTPAEGRSTPKAVALDLPALDAINRQWAAGQLSYADALKGCQDLVRQRRAKLAKPVVFHSENQRVLEEYWQAEYAHRLIIDAKGMRCSLNSAVDAIGTLSLLTASHSALQTLVNEKFGDRPGKHRRMCSRLNQLLAYLQRDFRLALANQEHPEIRHLTEAELKRVLIQLPTKYRPLVATLFYTGMRFGEVYEFQIRKKGVIRVEKQRPRGTKEKPSKPRGVKNRRPRTVAVADAGWKYVVECRKRMDAGEYPRHYSHLDVIKKAAVAAFPDDKTKHIVVHDLRHSFAIYMLNQGCNITEIALLLGDSVAVANQYYVGFVATDETIDNIRNKLSS